MSLDPEELTGKQTAAMLLHQMGSRLSSLCCGVAYVMVKLATEAGYQKFMHWQKLLFYTATGDWTEAASEMGSCFGLADCDALKATMTAGCPEKPWYAFDAGYKADFQKDVNDGAQRWEPGPITNAYKKYKYDNVPKCTLACASNSSLTNACDAPVQNAALCAAAKACGEDCRNEICIGRATATRFRRADGADQVR